MMARVFTGLKSSTYLGSSNHYLRLSGEVNYLPGYVSAQR